MQRLPELVHMTQARGGGVNTAPPTILPLSQYGRRVTRKQERGRMDEEMEE